MQVEQKYQNKIKTVDELKLIIETLPSEETVIMCHGTFDVVHPGHLRHLMYAKSKASKLIASVTCDAHVTKADFRPFVPQDLRAFNLAAFDFVDYVVIDENPNPLKNLSILQPNYFAKGFEYKTLAESPKTHEEHDLVKSYGGEMIFTPGDVVFSSSKIIDTNRPDISGEKLIALMQADNITFDDLRFVLDSLKGVKVHVVGDTIIDSYTDTSMIGGQTKTPTLSVRYENVRSYVGGAGIVAKHLGAAGADVTFSTVIGDDEFGEFAIKDLESSGIKINAIIDKMRPTVNKNAIVCGGYRLLKIDTVDNNPVPEIIRDKIASLIQKTDVNCIVFSDFRHGIFNANSIDQFSAAISPGVYKVADSQVASRWGNILDFQNFDLITPNEREARFSLGDQDSVIRPLALRLFQEANCKNLILTLGERGIMGFRNNVEQRESLNSFFVIDSFAKEVKDAVGSGDALLAYASLAGYITKDSVKAAVLGALAAAKACEFDGNIPVAVKSLRDEIDVLEQNLNFFKG